MKLKMTLLDTNKKIKDDILKIIFVHIDKAVDSGLKDIKDKTKNIIASSIKNEPEYNSLKSGQLRAELGIENADNIDNLINKILDTIEIKKTLKYNTRGLSGGLQLTMLSDTDLKSLFLSEEANISDVSRGYSLPWLEWLLTKGVSVIIKNYSVQMGSYPTSRTGMAIMVRGDNDWRVPPQFAGTNEDNWITRAISTSESQILSIIKSSIEQKL